MINEYKPYKYGLSEFKYMPTVCIECMRVMTVSKCRICKEILYPDKIISSEETNGPQLVKHLVAEHMYPFPDARLTDALFHNFELVAKSKADQ